MMEAEKYCK